MTHSHRWVLSILVPVLVLAVASPERAHAQGSTGAPAASGSEASNKAREAFQKANVHYALGEFAQAAELYQDAYKLKPDPALLYNAAQSFRLAGNSARALVLYKNYLLFYPQQKNIAEVKQQVINLQTAIASAEKAQSAPPMSTAQPAQPSTTAPTTTVAAATQPTTPTTEAAPTGEPTPGTVTRPAETAPVVAAAPVPAPKERKPVYKKAWFWVAVVGGAVVVAGAVTAGVIVSKRNDAGPDWATSTAFGSGARGLTVSQNANVSQGVGVSW